MVASPRCKTVLEGRALWQINLNFLWLIIPMLGAWAIWLVIEYLRWAETPHSHRRPIIGQPFLLGMLLAAGLPLSF